MLRPIENFVEAESDGVFTLWINKPVYKSYKTTDGYIRNTRTGENLGKALDLHISLYDENNMRRKNAVYEEDCYEIAEAI